MTPGKVIRPWNNQQATIIELSTSITFDRELNVCTSKCTVSSRICLPARSVRSAMLFTKYPYRPSSSRLLRLAKAVPDTTSSVRLYRLSSTCGTAHTQIGLVRQAKEDMPALKAAWHAQTTCRRARYLPDSQKRHEGGSAAAGGQSAQTLGQRGRHRHRHRRSTAAEDGGPREVCGQLEQRRRAGELLAPVGSLGVELAAADARALPGAVVRVLDGQRWQLRRRAAPAQRIVHGCQLAVQHAHAPSVAAPPATALSAAWLKGTHEACCQCRDAYGPAHVCIKPLCDVDQQRQCRHRGPRMGHLIT